MHIKLKYEIWKNFFLKWKFWFYIVYCMQYHINQFCLNFSNKFIWMWWWWWIMLFITEMSELLFECYHIPSVAYGVDGLFSLYANNPDFIDSLVVSCGYQTIHVLPVLGRSLDVQHCRRLNFGGAQVDLFMHRILQLKYPGHFSALTLTRAEVCLNFLFFQWIFISLLIFINLGIFISLWILLIIFRSS